MNTSQETKQIYGLKTSSYTFNHSVEMTSKMSDYDYSNDPSIRFPSTYLHEVIVFDNITHLPVISFEFPSDVCAMMVHTLYRLWASPKTNYSDHVNMIVRVPPENTSNHIISFICSYNDLIHPIIWCMIRKDTNSTPDFMFRLNGKDEIKGFIDLLETEDIVSMFVSPSTDRD